MPGGQYRPLTEPDRERIHRAALQVLETVGFSGASELVSDILLGGGCRLADDGRILFPPALVEDVVAAAGRDIVLYGQVPSRDIHITGSGVHFGTGGAAVHVIDPETGAYRDSTLADLYDIARLVDTLDNLHLLQRPVVARDMADAHSLDINTAYAIISGTTKPVGTSFMLAEHVREAVEVCDIVGGGEGSFRKRPFMSMSCCFVVPPLRFAEEACEALIEAVRLGMPCLLLSAGQAGATSPAALAGAAVQAVAEVLAGLVFVNLIQRGHPAIFGTWPFVSDLRTGAMSGGSGEQALLMAACAQMGRYYDLPTGVAAGMSDSKVPDAQSGFEKGYTTALAALAGANMVYESAGMQASLLSVSFEGFAIDDDMLGAVLRTVRGIEVTDETLSLHAIGEVARGPCHYLGHGQTISLMEREYLYPRLSDRSSPSDWTDAGATDIRQRALAGVRDVLSRHYPDHIDDRVDGLIRARSDIRLPRKWMKPGSGRW